MDGAELALEGLDYAAGKSYHDHPSQPGSNSIPAKQGRLGIDGLLTNAFVRIANLPDKVLEAVPGKHSASLDS